MEFIQDWDHTYQVAVGAIRSGKTFGQVFKIRDFLFNRAIPNVDGILAGKAGDTITRNVIKPFIDLLQSTGQLKYFKFKEQPRTITFLPKNVVLWVLGGNDEGAWERVMGMTSQVYFGDEQTLQPEGFVLKCIERTSAGEMFKVWTSNNDAPTHWLKTKYIDNYALKDDLIEYKFLLKDNPSLSKAYIKTLYATHKGIDKQRYLEAKWAANTEELIVPEIHEKEGEVVRDVKRPNNCYKIVSMDPGFDDNCALIFGYYDFENARGVVEDSLFLRGANTQTIAHEIKRVEDNLWGGERPYGRYSDIDKTLVSDLRSIHNIGFTLAKKGQGNKASKVNKIRVMIDNGGLVILPKNERLIYQLKTGQWRPLKTTSRGDTTRDFIRTEEERHFDGIDALGDFCRYLPVHIPKAPKPVYTRDMHVVPEMKTTVFGNVMRMFGSE